MAVAFFIFETVLAWIVLTAIQIPLRDGEHRVARTSVFVAKLLLIPTVAMLFVSIVWPMPYTHGDILCAIYVALIGDVVASVLEYVIRRIRARKDEGLRHGFDHRIDAPLALSVCVIVLTFGMINAGTLHTDTHDWQADGLEQTHTFAFAADLHTGSAQSMDVLRDFCRQVNQSDAEFLILGGDVTDELTTYEDMVETYRILSTVDIPMYMIYGNHDRQPDAHYVGGRTYTDEQLLAAINDAGITLLTDDYVLVAPDLVLLGREDISAGDDRKAWSDLVNPYAGKTLIVADHQPYDNEQLKAGESALQLSGHTHAGQLWPLQAAYMLLGLQAYGDFCYSHTHLYVTPGFGVWDVPLRTEAHCAWELITIHP